MAKRFVLIFILSILLTGCAQATTTVSTAAESACKDTPLAAGCFVPSEELDFISSDPDEYTIEETFAIDRLNQQPANWLLYSNAEYEANGVYARVVESAELRYVEMYSDGQHKPAYPQSAPTPSFIFTTKFNLDIDRKGIAYADVMIPSVGKNAVAVGVATGAVNTISITIDNDLELFVKVGGPFYYYSQAGDGGDYYETGITIEADRWYSFRFEWDAGLDLVQAWMLEGETETRLYEGAFHISNRFNGAATGAILVPNVFKVTMPYGQAGKAYLDNVIVTRKGE